MGDGLYAMSAGSRRHAVLQSKGPWWRPLRKGCRSPPGADESRMRHAVQCALSAAFAIATLVVVAVIAAVIVTIITVVVVAIIAVVIDFEFDFGGLQRGG